MSHASQDWKTKLSNAHKGIKQYAQSRGHCKRLSALFIHIPRGQSSALSSSHGIRLMLKFA